MIDSPDALEARGGAEEVAVVDGEHDGAAVRRLDDAGEAVLKSPRHGVDLRVSGACVAGRAGERGV